MKATLLWDVPGIYVPIVNCGVLVEWKRDCTGNPLVGVQVDNIDNARTFAAVKQMFFRSQEKAQ